MKCHWIFQQAKARRRSNAGKGAEVVCLSAAIKRDGFGDRHEGNYRPQAGGDFGNLVTF